MKYVIDFNRTYNLFDFNDCLIVSSKRFLDKGLKNMPSETVQDLVRRGIFCQNWNLARELMYGKQGGE